MRSFVKQVCSSGTVLSKREWPEIIGRRRPWRLLGCTYKLCQGWVGGSGRVWEGSHPPPPAGAVWKHKSLGGRATGQPGFCYVFAMKTWTSIPLMSDREPWWIHQIQPGEPMNLLALLARVWVSVTYGAGMTQKPQSHWELSLARVMAHEAGNLELSAWLNRPESFLGGSTCLFQGSLAGLSP